MNVNESIILIEEFGILDYKKGKSFKFEEKDEEGLPVVSSKEFTKYSHKKAQVFVISSSFGPAISKFIKDVKFSIENHQVY